MVAPWLAPGVRVQGMRGTPAGHGVHQQAAQPREADEHTVRVDLRHHARAVRCLNLVRHADVEQDRGANRERRAGAHPEPLQGKVVAVLAE